MLTPTMKHTLIVMAHLEKQKRSFVTLHDLALALGYKANSTIHQRINNLAERGFVNNVTTGQNTRYAINQRGRDYLRDQKASSFVAYMDGEQSLFVQPSNGRGL